MNNRQEVNKKILKEIENMVDSNPELRFHQILQILNIVKLDKIIYGGIDNHEIIEQLSTDKFSEESEITLKTIKK